MRRGLVLLLLSLSVTAAAIPWLIGQRLQERYGLLLDELRRGGLQIAGHRYSQGWLSSEAVTDLVLPGNGFAELRFQAESQIHHFSPGAGSRLAAARTLLTPQAGGPVFALDSTLAWTGESRSELTLLHGGQPIGRILFHPERQRVETSVAFQELAFPAANGGQHQLRGLSLRSNTYLGAAGLRLGDMELWLDGAESGVSGVEGPVQLQGLQLSTDASAEKGRVLLTSRWRIGSVRVGGFSAQRLEAELRLQGISAVLLARTARLLPLFLLERPPPGGPQMALAGTLLANFTRLLESEPSLSLEHLRLSTPDGELDARLHWRLRQPDPQQVLDPNHWLQRLELEGRLHIGEALARRLVAAVCDESEETGWIDDLLRQGLLQQRGDELFTALWIRDGLLQVNEQRISLWD